MWFMVKSLQRLIFRNGGSTSIVLVRTIIYQRDNLYNAMKLPAPVTCILRPRLPVATFHQMQRRLTCMLLHLND